MPTEKLSPKTRSYPTSTRVVAKLGPPPTWVPDLVPGTSVAWRAPSDVKQWYSSWCKQTSLTEGRKRASCCRDSEIQFALDSPDGAAGVSSGAAHTASLQDPDRHCASSSHAVPPPLSPFFSP